MANSMKQELMDDVTTPSGVKSRISKRPSDPGVAPTSPQPGPSSEQGSVPIPTLAQKVPAPFVSRPVGTLVSASAVKSAIMPARLSAPVPPRPAVKPPSVAAKPAPAEPFQPHQPTLAKTPQPHAISRAAQGAHELNPSEVATKPPPAKMEPPPSERTQIYRPNLTDPKVRRSNAPVSPFDSDSNEPYFPKQPRLPADVPAAAAPSPRAVQNVIDADPEDCTVALSSDALDRMIHEEKSASNPQSCAADEVTRAAEISIETLAALQSNPSLKGIGHDDVTRVYESPSREQNSDVTSPGQRQSRQLGSAQLLTEPRVIIKLEEPKRRSFGRWVFLGLCVAGIAAGWVYRAPLGKQMRTLQYSIARGIGAPVVSKANPPAAVSNVTVSIAVSPVDAKLTLDGNVVTNPYSAQLRPDRQLHKLIAEATGFATLERSFNFERDLTVVLALAPVPQQQPAADVAAAAPTEPAKTSASMAAPTEVATHPVPARHARVAAVVHSAPTPPATPTPTPARSASCDPPYTVDENGIKAFKPECM